MQSLGDYLTTWSNSAITRSLQKMCSSSAQVVYVFRKKISNEWMKGRSEKCRVVHTKCLDISSLLVGKFEGNSKLCWHAVSDLARHPFAWCQCAVGSNGAKHGGGIEEGVSWDFGTYTPRQKFWELIVSCDILFAGNGTLMVFISACSRTPFVIPLRPMTNK